MFGKRPNWRAAYKVGFDATGKITGLDMDWYSDPGSSANSSFMFLCYRFFHSNYSIKNYSIRPFLVKTNKPPCVEVRCPDVFNSISITEQIIERIANHLNLEPFHVRRVNFYNKGDITPTGHLLKTDIEYVVEKILEKSNYFERKLEIDKFNRLNKWKKRGISLIPLRYSITHCFSYYNALVSIKHHDGSIVISHGGIEMGQGIHTKCAQACAFQLGVPLESISVKTTNNLINPNGIWSGKTYFQTYLEKCLNIF